MSAWRDEFERRCRRILGVTDDAQRVYVWTSADSGCDTCGPAIDIEVSVGNGGRHFDDMGALIRALDAVPDEA